MLGMNESKKRYDISEIRTRYLHVMAVVFIRKRTLIVKNLFKKETNIEIFNRMKVELSNGESGKQFTVNSVLLLSSTESHKKLSRYY